MKRIKLQLNRPISKPTPMLAGLLVVLILSTFVWITPVQAQAPAANFSNAINSSVNQIGSWFNNLSQNIQAIFAPKPTTVYIPYPVFQYQSATGTPGKIVVNTSVVNNKPTVIKKIIQPATAINEVMQPSEFITGNNFSATSSGLKSDGNNVLGGTLSFTNGTIIDFSNTHVFNFPMTFGGGGSVTNITNNYTSAETDPWFMLASSSLSYLKVESDPLWSLASTTLTVANFATSSISQWVNDAGYLTTVSAETDPNWTAVSSTIPYLSQQNTFTATNTIANLIVNGRVGIGTISPAEALEVNGNIRATGQLIANGGGMSLNAGSVYYASGINLQYWTGVVTTGLKLTNTGLVGIGTTTPLSTLTVQATSGISALNIVSSSGSSMLNIAANGNIGIGTTNPQALLQVRGFNGATYSGFNFIPVTTATGDNTLAMYSGVTSNNILGGYSTVTGNSQATINLSNNRYIAFGVSSTGTANTLEVMRIDSSGKIGIGTTSPTSLLHLGTSIAVDAAIGFNSQNYNWTMGIDNSNSGRFVLSNSTALGTSDIFSIDTSGNIFGSNFYGSSVVAVGASWGVRIRSNSGISWSGSTLYNGTTDLGLARFATSTLQVTDTLGGMGNLVANNIGIGTTTPANPLHVYVSGAIARAKIESNTNSSGLILTSAGTSGGIYYAMDAVNALSLQANNGTKMLIDQNGLVGIGTTTPSFKLHVYGSANGSVSSMVENANAGASAYASYSMYNNLKRFGEFGINSSAYSNGSYPVIPSDSTFFNTNGSGGLVFLTQTGDFRIVTGGTQIANERFRITTTGNIGIGTTTPQSILTVQSTSRISALNVVSSTGASMFTVAANGNVGVGQINPTNLFEIQGITTGTGGTGSVLKVVQNGGWSANSPYALDVTGYSNLGGFRINGSVGVRGIYQTGSGTQLDFASNNGAITFTNGSGGTAERIRIDTSGNLGIGTTTPTQQLEISKNFALPLTVGSTTPYGIIYKGTSPFISDFNYGWNGVTTTAGANTFVGIGAGNLTMGSTATIPSNSSYNTAVGYNALHSNTTGMYNTAIGYLAMDTGSGGSENTALGWGTMRTVTGIWNVALGANTMPAVTSGSRNMAIGQGALLSNISGDDNVAIGRTALRNRKSGFNVAIGTDAGNAGTIGVNSVYLGYNAGYYDNGDNNIFLGYGSGKYLIDGATTLTSSTQSMYLGYGSMGFSNSDLNSIVIGYMAKGIGANSVVLGNDSILTTALKGNIGIGTTTPLSVLTVQATSGVSALNVVSSTGASMFNVDANGKVGIGASSNPGNPGGMLYVVPPAGITPLALYSNAAAAFTWYANFSGSNTLVGSFSYANQTTAAVRANVANLSLGAGGADNLFTLRSSGFVGIGTTTPSAKLQVTGTAGSGDVFTVSSSTNTSMFTVLANGNVGIGTATPQSALDITGLMTIRQPGGTSTEDQLEISHDGTAVIFENKSTNVGGTLRPMIFRNRGYNGGATFDWGMDTAGQLFTTSGFGLRFATNAGQVGAIMNTGWQTRSAFQFMWSQDANPAGTADTGLARYATGTLKVTNGSSGWGSLLTNSLAVGTTTNIATLSVQATSGVSALNVVSSTGASMLIVATNGNVGIGTASPTQALQVAGVLPSTTSGIFSEVVDIGSHGGSSGNAKLGVVYPGVGTVSYGGIWLNQASPDVTNYAFLANGGGGASLFNTPSGQFMAFRVGNVTKMYIDNGGLVGIGTTTPSAKLQVTGTAGSGDVFTVSSSTNSSMFTVLANGNVGIGATAPQKLLHVNGQSRFDGAMSFGYSGDAGFFTWGDDRFIVKGQSGKAMSFGAGGTNDYLYITTAGLVGIGTTSPISTLYVKGITGVNPFTISSSTDASLFTVLQNGKVGVGSASPGEKLTVSGGGIAIDNAQKIYFNGAGDNNWRIGKNTGAFTRSLATQSAIDIITSNNSIEGFAIGIQGGNSIIETNGSGTTYIRGSVGIGTTTPNALLNIFGTTSTLLRVATSTNQNILVIGSDGNATFGGSITSNNLLGGATNLTVDANGVIVRDPSDINLKENVTPLAGAMERVLALQGVSFNWKDKERFGTQEEIGFVAQQVQEVVPQLVSTGGSYLSLKYPNVTALLVEAFKEQYKLVSTDTLAMFGTTTATTTSYWMTTSTLANTTSTEMTTLIASSTAIDIIINRLATGFSIVREFFAEKIVAAIGVFDQLKTRIFETDVAKINTGMEIKDAVTGEIYCVRIVNGEWVKVKGVCNVAGAYEAVTPTIVVPETTATEVPASNTSSTEVVETPIPIPPAEEIIAPVAPPVVELVSPVETVVTETPPTE